jgi:hypothetical protein
VWRPFEIASFRSPARRIAAGEIDVPEGLSRFIRAKLPLQLDEYGAVGGLELPCVELIKVAFGIPVHQLHELRPLGLAQASTHEMHHAVCPSTAGPVLLRP